MRVKISTMPAGKVEQTLHISERTSILVRLVRTGLAVSDPIDPNSEVWRDVIAWLEDKCQLAARHGVTPDATAIEDGDAPSPVLPTSPLVLALTSVERLSAADREVIRQRFFPADTSVPAEQVAEVLATPFYGYQQVDEALTLIRKVWPAKPANLIKHLTNAGLPAPDSLQLEALIKAATAVE